MSVFDIFLWAFGGIGASALVYVLARIWDRSQYERVPLSPSTSVRSRNDFGSPSVDTLDTYFGSTTKITESTWETQPAAMAALPLKEPDYAILLDSVLSSNPPKDNGASISVQSSIAEKKDAEVYDFFSNPNFNDAFKFNAAETQVSKWEDNTVALADDQKFLYGDPVGGLIIASIQDPSRWDTKVTKKPGKIIVEYTDRKYK